MLYDQWRQIARERAKELALLDVASGRRWTFAQLSAAAECERGEEAAVVFPMGASPDFIFSVLRGWRAGRIVCPLEEGQPRPEWSNLPENCAHLKTTSASGGVPRQVAFSAEQLIADAGNIMATMEICPNWPNLGVISLAHSYGFSNLVLPLLLHGVPLILAGSPLPESLRQAAAAADSITLAAVPALWRTWREAGAIPRNVRLAISAGAPLPLALEQAVYDEAGLKIHDFYGSSECGGIAYDLSELPRTDGSCAGGPMRNVLLSIAADGCLEVRSKAVGMTYWPEPDEHLRAGCFRTSDLVKIDNGQVFLQGRAGDLINVAGRKLSPETVEQVLRGHPSVHDSLVFGTPGDSTGRGENIVACVAFRSPVTSDVLKQYLLSRLPAWQVPREWWLVEALETNQRGKLSRAEWRKRWLETHSNEA